MFLEKIKSEGLAHLSYILGDGGKAAVIDPRRDCEIYRSIADREGCRITEIFETHRNEDYVIGSTELARRTGATIRHGAALPFSYGEAVTEGDEFRLGDLTLKILQTPGHTDESISIVLYERGAGDTPVGVFSGDALFIGDTGRTDFFPDRREEVAGLLYDSIFNKLLPLGDQTILYPAHGSGSVCGSTLSAREFSTLGLERRRNPGLQVKNRDEFVARKAEEFHYLPPYFQRMEILNLEGTPPGSMIPRPAPASAAEFSGREGEPGTWLLFPLESGEGKTGGLALGRGEGRPFSPEEEEIGRLVSYHLGQALRKAGEARRRGGGEKLPVNFFRRAGLERKIQTLRFLSRSLAAERSLLSAMLSAIADGVVVADLLGSPLLLNRPAREILSELGEDPDRLRIIPLLSRLLNLPEGELAARARGIITAGETLSGEAAAGDRTYLVSLSAFRREAGPAGGLMAVFTEITSLKKLDRLRAETMAMLSHEIARPVSGIVGFCDLYAQGLVRAEEIGEYMGLIKTAAAGLKELLRDYLAAARLEAGAGEVAREEISPAELLEESLRLLAGRAAEKEIVLETEISSPAPRLRGDGKLLAQALQNLVENAIAYSPTGSTVKVSCGRRGEETVFRVADRGPGIPGEEREKIFNKFYRGKKTRDISGTGLGLSISRQVAERHGGGITVEAREGGGTVFSIFLPKGGNTSGPEK